MIKNFHFFDKRCFCDYHWKFQEPLACFCYMYSTSSFVVWLKALKTQNILLASALLILSQRRFERKLLPKSRLMLLPFNDLSSCKKVPFLGPRKKNFSCQGCSCKNLFRFKRLFHTLGLILCLISMTWCPNQNASAKKWSCPNCKIHVSFKVLFLQRWLFNLNFKILSQFWSQWYLECFAQDREFSKSDEKLPRVQYYPKMSN